MTDLIFEIAVTLVACQWMRDLGKYLEWKKEYG